MKNILLSGAVINFVLVIVGGAVGSFLKRGMPERLRNILLSGMALCVLYIGVSGLIPEDGVKIKALVVILSVAFGALIGELINLDKFINKTGKKMEEKFSHDKENATFAEGFVTATMVFCIGAMTVVGSIESGIDNNNTILYSKSLIDCVTACVFASTLGIGVAFSAIPVLIIEGSLTLLAASLAPFLDNSMIAHMTIVGSLLIISIAFNTLKITKIKIMNLLPAVFLPIGLCLVI